MRPPVECESGLLGPALRSASSTTSRGSSVRGFHRRTASSLQPSRIDSLVRTPPLGSSRTMWISGGIRLMRSLRFVERNLPNSSLT